MRRTWTGSSILFTLPFWFVHLSPHPRPYLFTDSAHTITTLVSDELPLLRLNNNVQTNTITLDWLYISECDDSVVIRYQDLVSLIDFMYHGEVAIPTEDVSVFLALAEQFKVHMASVIYLTGP